MTHESTDACPDCGGEMYRTEGSAFINRLSCLDCDYVVTYDDDGELISEWGTEQ